MNYELNIPYHWKVLSLVNDLIYVSTGVDEYEGEKKYYSTGGIQKNNYREEDTYSYNEKPSRANRIVTKGDVLQARMKETNKAIIVSSELDGTLFSTGFFQLRPNPQTYNPKFLYYYLKLRTLQLPKLEKGILDGREINFSPQSKSIHLVLNSQYFQFSRGIDRHKNMVTLSSNGRSWRFG